MLIMLSKNIEVTQRSAVNIVKIFSNAYFGNAYYN